MVDPEKQYYRKLTIDDYLTKKCPECYEHLPLEAQICAACRVKVGDVDKLGFAERPTDWWSYMIAAVSMVGFAVFTWWAFFRK